MKFTHLWSKLLSVRLATRLQLSNHQVTSDLTTTDFLIRQGTGRDSRHSLQLG